ncbi:MAG TPA: Ig-like domain-containing protein [Rubrivivax sp.]|nr:Ig-like domain-containing protein [Rubrivivax sp.]
MKHLFALLLVSLVAGCGGGGGNSGTPPFNTGGTTTPGSGTASVADLEVQLSSPTIANSGAAVVTATVTALDVNRNAISGADVVMAVDNGGVLTILGTAGSVTNATGRLQAQVSIGTDRTNRDLNVSASVGSIKKSAVLKVVDSPAAAIPSSIEVLSAATTVGTGGDGVLIRAFVKDVNNNALPNATVSFRASTGTLTGVSTQTSAAGVAEATFAAGADRSNRSAEIVVSSGAVTSTLTLPITGTRLTLSGPSSMILGTSANIDVVITDSKSNAVPGVSVSGASPLGNSLVATSGSTTNNSGQIRFRYTAGKAGTDAVVFSGAGATASPSPALVVSGEDFSFVSPVPSSTVQVGTPQPVQVRLRSGGVPQAGKLIHFAATGGTLTTADVTTDADGQASTILSSNSAGPVTVQASVDGSTTSTTLPLVVIATVPAKLVLQVTPTAIGPNASIASGNQAQVVAKVTDAAGNPVQGQVINFARQEDPSGGDLLQATATTDSSGQASVAYRSGSGSTANNGVVLRATVAGTPAVTGTATLTVNQTSLFIALGTGNTISNLDTQTYRKDWVVYVTDSNGNPQNGVTLTIKAIPNAYRTGKLRFDGVVWTYATPIWSCRNEDANEDGTLDAAPVNEDDNGDGVLWPGNVIAVSPGSVQTVNGRATISLTYAESYAPWVELRLTASATVTGTESRTDAVFVVSGSSEDFSNQTNPPAGVASPFGLTPKAGAICSQVQ